MRRSFLSVLTVVTFVVALGATLMTFAQDRFFDASSFSTTLSAAAEDPAVNEYLATAISDALIDEVPDLAIGGPLLADVTGSVLASDVATRALETAAFQTHATVFDAGNDTVVLDVAELVVYIEQALAAVAPDLADEIPDDISSLAVDISSGDFASDLAQLAESLRLLTFVLVAATVVLLVAVVALEPTLFGGLTRMGLVLGAVGLALVVLRGVGATVVRSYGSDAAESDALAGAWNVVFGDLATWGWVLIIVGGFLAALGWAVLQASSSALEPRRLVDHLVREPSSRAGRATRTLGLLLVAVWALLQPETILTAAIRIAGFGLAVAIVSRLIVTSGIGARLTRLIPESHDDVVSIASIGRKSVVPIATLVGLGAIGVWLLSANNDASALLDPQACNGHVELCDRRLDQVTIATSHNAMSSTATGFLLPNHLTTMRAQLDQGVRGFMIDTVYGRQTPNGSVRTSFDPPDTTSLDAAAIGAVETERDRPGPELEDERVYLCHAFCEIGALDAADSLRGVRQWIDAHPREVVVFIVQDATSPEDTAAVFDDAGFGDLVHRQSIGEPFPTLGEMIESGRRVFVMVEEDAGQVPWLHDGFEFSQETPFSFAAADEFVCTKNRGGDDSPLFVINHFITFARAGNRTINDFDALLARAEQCRDERDLHPNFLAVDFVGEGDVMAVVDKLNNVD